jgi:hypothetical protein
VKHGLIIQWCRARRGSIANEGAHELYDTAKNIRHEVGGEEVGGEEVDGRRLTGTRLACEGVVSLLQAMLTHPPETPRGGNDPADTVTRTFEWWGWVGTAGKDVI